MTTDGRYEEPFWRTLPAERLEGMTVKALFATGATVTGRLEKGSRVGQPMRIDLGGGASVNVLTGLSRVPMPGVLRIERGDEPGMDGGIRVDDVTKARKGDVMVAKSGNRYTALGAYDPEDETILVDIEGMRAHRDRSTFDHILRRKVRVPDRPGLWMDGRGILWCVEETWNGDLCMTPLQDEDGEWANGDTRLIPSLDLSTCGDFHPCHAAADGKEGTDGKLA